jgi:hypothetical protein
MTLIVPRPLTSGVVHQRWFIGHNLVFATFFQEGGGEQIANVVDGFQLNRQFFGTDTITSIWANDSSVAAGKAVTYLGQNAGQGFANNANKYACVPATDALTFDTWFRLDSAYEHSIFQVIGSGGTSISAEFTGPAGSPQKFQFRSGGGGADYLEYTFGTTFGQWEYMLGTASRLLNLIRLYRLNLTSNVLEKVAEATWAFSFTPSAIGGIHLLGSNTSRALKGRCAMIRIWADFFDEGDIEHLQYLTFNPFDPYKAAMLPMAGGCCLPIETKFGGTGISV